jgi:hypothetical protein
MQTRTIPTRQRIVRATIGVVAVLALLLTTTVNATAVDLDGPSEYRDCWLGSQTLYRQCVDANNWGASFSVDATASLFHFPDPDAASLTIDGLPSY